MKLGSWRLTDDSFYSENAGVKVELRFYTLYVDGKPYYDFCATLEDVLPCVKEYLKLNETDRSSFKFN